MSTPSVTPRTRTQISGRDADGSGSTSMKQGRVKLCNCQILACHVMTSRPSPLAVFVKLVSQLVNAPRWDGDALSSTLAFTRHSVWARPASASCGGDGGTNAGVASIGATEDAGS